MDYSSIEKNIISLYAKIKNKKLPLRDLPVHSGMIKGFAEAIINGNYVPSQEGLYALLMLNLDQYSYGNNGDVILSDHEYDLLHILYMDHGGKQIIYPDTFESQWKLVPHKAKWMVGSVAKSYTVDEMYDFIDDICRSTNKNVYEIEWIISPKFDGISACLEIKNHQLIQAITRGTRAEGQDITAVVAKAANLSDILMNHDTGFMKVELCVPQKYFEPLRLQGYKNRRSATSAIVNSPKNLDNAQYIEAVPLLWYESRDDEYGYHIDYNPPDAITIKDVENKRQIMDQMLRLLATLKDPKNHYEYRVDGVILFPMILYKNLNDVMENSMAFKINTAEALTTIKYGYVSMGRTGRAVPMIKVEPYEVNETIVEDVTLGSFALFKRMHLYEGERVIIYSAGDVIPEMKFPEKRMIPDGAKLLRIPEICPYCGSELVDAACPNPMCKRKITGRITNFLERTDITSDISDKTIEDLYDAKKIRNIVDLFKLQVNDIASLNGYTEAGAMKMINQFNILRTTPIPYSRFFGALGCPGISLKIAAGIFDAMTMDELMGLKGWDRVTLLMSVDKLGMTRAQIISDFIDQHYQEIYELMEIMNLIKDRKYFGNVVFSGFRDSSWEAKFDQIGFRVGDSVTRETAACIVANMGTTKAKAALKKGTPLYLSTDIDRAYADCKLMSETLDKNLTNISYYRF